MAPRGAATRDLAGRLDDAPDQPGVYLFLDRRKRVLYVGKAKSLRRRVASYFGAGPKPARTAALVREARHLEWLVTANEVEALVLENSLVKKNRPRYNVHLRDDKNHPWLRITTTEDFPQVDIVRGARRDGNAYFGPFLPASTARRTTRLLARHFGLRSCKGPIETKDPRGCLYFHLHQCLAPCAGQASREEYGAAVKDAVLFLEGQDGPLRERLQERMRGAAVREDYERAAHYRDLDRMVESLRQEQRMASRGLEQEDAWGLARSGRRALLAVVFVRDGAVRGKRELVVADAGEASDAALLGDAVRLFYHGASFVPDRVALPVECDEPDLTREFLVRASGHAVELVVPRRGARAARVRWAGDVARGAFEIRFARGEDARRAAADLGAALGLAEAPERVECFDVSHVQGSDVVASMAVFVGGSPAPREHRRFIIRDASGSPDDTKAMAEVVGRRYRRLIEEGRDLPDLVLVDGGRGQLSAAARALDALELADLPLAALAKREELLFVRGRTGPVRLPRESAALQLAQRVRDEAHRLAVTFHRRRRAARTVASSLDDVPGVGPARRKALLRAFGSLEGVRRAGAAALAEVVGERVARAVRLHFGS